MSNYLVQGKLGTGKGKFTVRKMQDALRNGLRVATNCDLYLDKLMSANHRGTVSRLPDKPTPFDLDVIGPGCAEEHKYDEDKYGVMVLDELGSWLNARSFNSPARAAFIEWLIHARKKRWHVYFIAQDLNMIDRQVREALVEYLVKVVRGDKMRIPVVGPLLGKLGKLKGVHIANMSLVDMPGFVVDREWFRGKDVQDGYDTLQIFREWARDPKEPAFQDEIYQGPFSYLSAWHLKGRYLAPQPARSALQRLFGAKPKPAPARKPKLPMVAHLERLAPDQAWKLARAYVQVTDRRAAA